MQTMTLGDLVAMRNVQLSGGGLNAAGMQMGDGLDGIFAALFAQLMGDGGQVQAQNADELIAGILDGESRKKDEPNVQAMEMLANALFTLQDMDPLQVQQYEELIQTVLGTGTADIEPAQLLEAVTLTQQGAAVQTAAAADSLPAAPGEEKDSEWETMLESLTASWEETPEAPREMKTNADFLMEQMRSQSAVRTVREALAEKSRTGEQEKEEPAPIDIEALQQAVDSKQFVPETVAAQKPAADIREIASQLKTGILENVRQGKNEFVVRLKPEGLGEITVKFSESKNEIALRIVTSSASVGKMIAEDVAVLQNALRPLRAQVQEIVTVPPANEAYAAGTALAGDNANRQFTWHNGEGEQQSQSRSHTRRGEVGFDAAMKEVEQTVPEDSGLNLLI